MHNVPSMTATDSMRRCSSVCIMGSWQELGEQFRSMSTTPFPPLFAVSDMLPTRTRDDMHFGGAEGKMTSARGAAWAKLPFGKVNLWGLLWLAGHCGLAATPCRFALGSLPRGFCSLPGCFASVQASKGLCGAAGLISAEKADVGDEFTVDGRGGKTAEVDAQIGDCPQHAIADSPL